ncbi:MAG: hypothetical protein ACFFBP_16275 [Promethearchaeota archaeon]
MKQVKGSIFKEWAITIRANKSGVYDNLITEESKKMINQLIIDAAWYPFESFKDCLNAVCKVDANGDLNVIQKWGYESAQKTIDRIYKDRMKKRGVKLAITAYDHFFQLWFNFGHQNGEIVSDNEINITFNDFDRDFKFFYYVASGWIKCFFEAYLDTKVITNFLQKSWESAEKTVINLTWNT